MERSGLAPIASMSTVAVIAAMAAVIAASVGGPAQPHAPRIAIEIEPSAPAASASLFAREAPEERAPVSAAAPSAEAEPSIAPDRVAAQAAEAPRRTWPRLKPMRDRAPVAKARPLSGATLAADTPVGIAAAEDITGGRESLFADYRAQLAVARDEDGYVTYASQTGEDVAGLLKRAGFAVPAGLTAALQTVSVEGALAAGTAVAVASGKDGSPQRLRLVPDAGVEVVAWLGAEGWQARREVQPVTVSHVTAASVMTDSLFGAGARAGVPREVMARMANLFLYDVDFVRDVRRGDRFEVVYEVMHDAAGEPVGTGEIVFAAMTWRGGRQSRGYYRFEGADGTEARYFDANGASARRLLMKTPIEGARVTSRFGPRRHPTLGYTKAHKGVDFGARSGTPIMAAGDGTVLAAGPRGSYGNFLLIRHANGFETAYAHLNGFAKGVRKGARVRQGDVVAFVGSTGRSTGPHLHYEVREAGRQVNPMTLDVATGTVLDGQTLTAFAEVRHAADSMRGRPLAVAAGD